VLVRLQDRGLELLRLCGFLGVEVDTDHARDCLGVLELLSVNWELLVARPLLRGFSFSGSSCGSAASSRLLGVEVDSDHTRRYLGVLVLPLGLKGASYSSATKRLNGMTGTLASVLLLLVRWYHTNVNRPRVYMEQTQQYRRTYSCGVIKPT